MAECIELRLLQVPAIGLRESVFRTYLSCCTASRVSYEVTSSVANAM